MLIGCGFKLHHFAILICLSWNSFNEDCVVFHFLVDDKMSIGRCTFDRFALRFTKWQHWYITLSLQWAFATGRFHCQSRQRIINCASRHIWRSVSRHKNELQMTSLNALTLFFLNNFRNGFKGDELSAIDISKGLKEGNRAFLKVTL